VLIHVSPNNPKPMYEQIVDEIQRLIAMRVLEPDELLPSIRQLSKELTTSAITIRRAYQELEGSGFIYTRAGRGSFVAQLSEDDIMAWKLKQVQEPLTISIQQAKRLNLSEEQFHQMINKLWKNIYVKSTEEEEKDD